VCLDITVSLWLMHKHAVSHASTCRFTFALALLLEADVLPAVLLVASNDGTAVAVELTFVPPSVILGGPYIPPMSGGGFGVLPPG
jgi:hypothetical protein